MAYNYMLSLNGLFPYFMAATLHPVVVRPFQINVIADKRFLQTSNKLGAALPAEVSGMNNEIIR
jgi:hypothetical protein